MRKLIHIIIFGFIILLTNSYSHSQTSVSIRLGPNTGQDCLALSNFPNTSFPEHPDLAGLAGTVFGEYYAGRSFFKFDLSEIPSDSNVIEARLSLYANPNPSNNTHDGAVDQGERDPNNPGDDLQGPVCGDGRIEGGEACDDGDTDDGDGCNASCQVESGWSCVGEPSMCTEDPAPAHARVVAHDVDRSEALAPCVAKVVDGGRVAHVALDGQHLTTDLGLGRPERLGLDVGDDDRRTGRGERLRHGETDARGTAGDDRDLAVEIFHAVPWRVRVPDGSGTVA